MLLRIQTLIMQFTPNNDWDLHYKFDNNNNNNDSNIRTDSHHSLYCRQIYFWWTTQCELFQFHLCSWYLVFKDEFRILYSLLWMWNENWFYQKNPRMRWLQKQAIRNYSRMQGLLGGKKMTDFIENYLHVWNCEVNTSSCHHYRLFLFSLSPYFLCNFARFNKHEKYIFFVAVNRFSIIAWHSVIITNLAIECNVYFTDLIYVAPAAECVIDEKRFILWNNQHSLNFFLQWIPLLWRPKKIRSISINREYNLYCEENYTMFQLNLVW